VTEEREDDEDDGAAGAVIELTEVPGHFGIRLMPMLVGGTSFYVPFGRLKDLRYSVLAGVVADTFTGNLPASVGAAVVAQVASVVRKLSREELEVLWIINKCSSGHPYTVWLDTDKIVERAADEDLDRDHVLRTLANMKSRGILEEGAGKWRAVW
jgi:uncharacterized protein YacL (UPF0231 family)